MGNSGRGAGGTSGGIMEFLVGALLMIAGGYLLTSHVQVISRGYSLRIGSAFETSSFGLSMIPLLIGIVMLFFNTKNILGWIMTGIGAVIILLGIISNLDIYFRPTSLFNTLLMLGMIAAGFGLVLRGLNPHDD